MRILLSNDDGILAPGLAALRAVLEDFGEVTVVAPATPQSAAGSGITVTRPLTVKEITVRGPCAFTGLSVDGRPADCVRLALRKLLPEPPDLVLSGINRGANVGIHVFYSGTVAAAAEGALWGLPAVAFSAAVAGDREPPFDRVAEHCRKVLKALLGAGLEAGDLVNVNVPDLHAGRPAGLHVVPQSTSPFSETYDQATDTEGLPTYALGDYQMHPEEADSDVASLHERFITVTPLGIDRTRRERMAGLDGIDWSWLG